MPECSYSNPQLRQSGLRPALYSLQTYSYATHAPDSRPCVHARCSEDGPADLPCAQPVACGSAYREERHPGLALARVRGTQDLRDLPLVYSLLPISALAVRTGNRHHRLVSTERERSKPDLSGCSYLKHLYKNLHSEELRGTQPCPGCMYTCPKRTASYRETIRSGQRALTRTERPG